MAFVLAAGIWSLPVHAGRHVAASRQRRSPARSGRSCRAPSLASAVLGPPNDWPGVTVSRFVPSASISATSSARLDAEIPSTATMVAIPSAMPGADSTLRAGRITSPASATGHRSAGRIRLPAPARLALTSLAVVLNAAVPQPDPPARRGRDVRVVGHDEHGDAAFVQARQDREDTGPRGGVQAAGGFVGEEDRWLTHDRARDGDSLPFTAG